MAEDELASLVQEQPDSNIPVVADDLVDPQPGIAQVAGFDLAIAADPSGAHVDLAWPDQGPGFVYDVWRSSDPYFFPGDPDSTLLVDDLAFNQFRDISANIDDNSYYYRIETDGDDEYLSTIAGKFVQPIASHGYSFIGFPLLNTGNYDAQSLAADIPGVVKVKRWGPYKIYFGPDHPAPEWDAPNFSWNPGDAVAVFNNGTADTTYTQLGTVPIDTDLLRTLGPGPNLATIPLSLEPADAIGLAARVPTVTQLDDWNLSTQAMDNFYAPQWGTNFHVNPGHAMWIHVDAPTPWPPRTPFFSEYVEGTSNNKAVEVYNPTGSAFDLDDCVVQIYRGGNPAVGDTMRLAGSLAAGDTLVLCDDNADDLGPCDLINTRNFWNGDDTVVLTCGGVAFDVLGQIGFDPGAQWNVGGVSTLNQTLRRNCGVETGDPEGTDEFDPSAQWSSFAVNDFSDLGQFSCP
ncbi:MAG: hypothetical protein K0V04_24630 [Deltaproteobacteria bacterium]|nr:hypothetical protein [Deltaproteobacteria bacterium]